MTLEQLVTGQPNAEQRAALAAYAKTHGRYWKSLLNLAWFEGTDANEPDGNLLRQVRNQFGPTWLINYRPE